MVFKTDRLSNLPPPVKEKSWQASGRRSGKLGAHCARKLREFSRRNRFPDALHQREVEVDVVVGVERCGEEFARQIQMPQVRP